MTSLENRIRARRTPMSNNSIKLRATKRLQFPDEQQTSIFDAVQRVPVRNIARQFDSYMLIPTSESFLSVGITELLSIRSVCRSKVL